MLPARYSSREPVNCPSSRFCRPSSLKPAGLGVWSDRYSSKEASGELSCTWYTCSRCRLSARRGCGEGGSTGGQEAPLAHSGADPTPPAVAARDDQVPAPSPPSATVPSAPGPCQPLPEPAPGQPPGRGGTAGAADGVGTAPA